MGGVRGCLPARWRKLYCSSLEEDRQEVCGNVSTFSAPSVGGAGSSETVFRGASPVRPFLHFSLEEEEKRRNFSVTADQNNSRNVKECICQDVGFKENVEMITEGLHGDEQIVLPGRPLLDR